MSEEITAVRGWALAYDSDGFVLQSPVMNGFTWRGPVRWASDVPNRTNLVGIYSLKPRSRYARLLRLQYNCDIIGRIALLGHVVQHEGGYRSSGAVIRALQLHCTPRFVTSDARRVIAELAGRYACDVTCTPQVKAWTTMRLRAQDLWTEPNLWT